MAASRSKLRDELLAALALPATAHGDLPAALDRLRSQRAVRDAAVLVGVLPRAAGATVLLTQRTEGLADHAGQVSFPGGRVEAGDRDAAATALRETGEELGIAPGSIDILGNLAEYHTISQYRVTPVVALLDPEVRWVPDPVEVADVFEFPLDYACRPENRRRHARNVLGEEVGYWSMEHDGRVVWGATAAMLVDLCERLERLRELQ